jgi:hypothetical protein
MSHTVVRTIEKNQIVEEMAVTCMDDRNLLKGEFYFVTGTIN